MIAWAWANASTAEAFPKPEASWSKCSAAMVKRSDGAIFALSVSWMD